MLASWVLALLVAVEPASPPTAAPPPAGAEDDLFLQILDPFALFAMVGRTSAEPAAPVGTEFNLDALVSDRNLYHLDIPVERGTDGWYVHRRAGGIGATTFRVARHANRYQVEVKTSDGTGKPYHELIDFVVERRDLRIGGQVKSMRVLRVEGYRVDE